MAGERNPRDQFERSRAGSPIIAEISESNRRLAVEIFPATDGVVFADSDWHDPVDSDQPFHYVIGPVTQVEAGHWRVGEVAFRVLRNDHCRGRFFLQWWRAWIERKVRERLTREQALAAARNLMASVEFLE